MSTTHNLRKRIAVFASLVVITSVAAVFVVLGSADHSKTNALRPGVDANNSTDPTNSIRYNDPTETNLQRLLAKPHYLTVRYPRTDGEPYAVEVVPAGDLSQPRVRTSLSCINIHFRAGRGLCVTPPTNALGTKVQIIDARLHVTRELTLAGSPSRARMSPDGLFGAVTNFLSGHSYADSKFTTATTVIDFTAGTSSNLETWAAFNGTKRVTDKSRNFWGVTFLGDDTFYVAMGVGADRYLLEGDSRTHELHVIGTHMECPSVAPDGKHLTFRRGIVETNGATSIPLFVLDLTTMTEQRLTFNETVDGQPEWLDNHRIAIGTPTGPPNLAVIDIALAHTGPEPWTILVPDALSATFVSTDNGADPAKPMGATTSTTSASLR